MDKKEQAAFLNQIFEEQGFSLTATQEAAFLCCYEKLVEENQKMNLTAITDFKEVVIKHFLDSVLPLSCFPLSGSLIDVGSGAGFPGVPLKIMEPSLSLTMLDSLNKRVRYLQSLSEELSLEQTEALHGRAEDAVKERREMYDIATARAVANLAVLAEYCLPFVKVGGVFIAYKGGDSEAELLEAEAALQKLGGKTEEIKHFALPEDAGERSLILIRKVKKTPAGFPRRAGLPAKEPIMKR